MENSKIIQKNIGYLQRNKNNSDQIISFQKVMESGLSPEVKGAML